jgi:transposase
LARWLRDHGIEAYVIHPASVAVSREHRRAKTDRLDTGMLKRAFLGWLRGEPGLCQMVAIPMLAQEYAKRPNRERESLVGERTRIVNRMKSGLARLGIRGSKPTLRKASEHLEALRTPEEAPLPPNTLAEMQRDMARLRFVSDQIKDIEQRRLQALEQAPEHGPHLIFWRSMIASARSRRCWSQAFSCRALASSSASGLGSLSGRAGPGSGRRGRRLCAGGASRSGSLNRAPRGAEWR